MMKPYRILILGLLSILWSQDVQAQKVIRIPVGESHFLFDLSCSSKGGGACKYGADTCFYDHFAAIRGPRHGIYAACGRLCLVTDTAGLFTDTVFVTTVVRGVQGACMASWACDQNAGTDKYYYTFDAFYDTTVKINNHCRDSVRFQIVSNSYARLENNLFTLFNNRFDSLSVDSIRIKTDPTAKLEAVLASQTTPISVLPLRNQRTLIDYTTTAPIFTQPTSFAGVIQFYTKSGGADSIIEVPMKFSFEHRKPASIDEVVFPLTFSIYDDYSRMKVVCENRNSLRILMEHYDILGRKMATLADAVLPSGVHEFSVKKQSEVSFIRLHCNGIVRTVKIQPSP